MSLLGYANIQPARKARAFPLSSRITFFYGELVRNTARPYWYRGNDATTDASNQASAVASAQSVLDNNLVSHAMWDYGTNIANQQTWRTTFGNRIALSNVINGYASASALNLGNSQFACLDLYGAPARSSAGSNGWMTVGTELGRGAMLGSGNYASIGYTNVGLEFTTNRPDLWSVIHHDDTGFMTEAAYYGGDFSPETIAAFQSEYIKFNLPYKDFQEYALTFGSLSNWTIQYRNNRTNKSTVEGQWFMFMQKLSRDFWRDQFIPRARLLNPTATVTANIYSATPTDEVSAWMWPHIDSGMCEMLFNQAAQHVFATRMHDSFGNGSVSIVIPTRQTFTWDGVNNYTNKWADKRMWATGVAYVVGDLVVAHPSSTTTNATPYSARTMYEVMVNHTSSNFSTDLSSVNLRKVRTVPIRQTIAATYAAGGNPTFPWSTYTTATTTSSDGSASFFYCETNDYSDLLGFVARNKGLFDGARNVPVVAIVIPFMQRFMYTNCKAVHPNCNAFDLYAFCETLCAAGVPFAIEPVGGTLDPISLPARLSKYAAVIKGSNADADFGTNLPTITGLGIPVFTRAQFVGSVMNSYATVAVTGGSGSNWVFTRVNPTLRRMYIHMVNFTWTEASDVPTVQSNVVLAIKPLAQIGPPLNMQFHAPLTPAQPKPVRYYYTGDDLSVILPPYNEWGILEVQF